MTDVASRITVALVPKAADALGLLHEQTGLSKTDLVNRALQVYAFLEEKMTGGGEVLVRSRDGKVNQVKFL